MTSPLSPTKRDKNRFSTSALGYKETRLGELVVGLASSDIEAVMEVPE